MEVLPHALAKKVDAVKQFHQGFSSAFERQSAYAFLCGLELLAIKAEIPHGNKAGEGFISFREKWLPYISNGAAHRYMDFAKLLQEKFPTVGNITSELLLKDGELCEEQKDVLLKAVHDVATGKTWTAFYRDLRLIRDKSKDPAPPHRKTYKEALAERKRHAEDLVRAAMGAMESVDKDTLERIDDNFRRELLDKSIELNQRIRKLTKGRRKPKV